MVISLSLNIAEKIIVFTSLTKAHLLEFNNEYKITMKKSIDLISKNGLRNIKCCIHQDKVAISDDQPQILICNLKDLSVEKKIEFKNPILDLNFNGEFVSAIESNKIYLYKNEKLVFEKDLPQKKENHSFKTVRFSKDGNIYCLHTGKGGPTYISKFNEKGDLIFTKNVYSKPGNSFEISNSQDSFFTVCIGDGILVLNSDLKQLFINLKIHGFATSCSDIFIEKDYLKVLSGAFDKSFGVQKVKIQTDSFFYYSILVFVLSLIIHQYRVIFNQ